MTFAPFSWIARESYLPLTLETYLSDLGAEETPNKEGNVSRSAINDCLALQCDQVHDTLYCIHGQVTLRVAFEKNSK